MDRLREWLASSGASVDALALAAGLDRSTVYGYLAGTRKPSLRSALEIERATGGAVPATAWVEHRPEVQP